MQVNKNGIPVQVKTKRKTPGSIHSMREKRQQELHKLNLRKFAEFVGYENGVEVTIIVPNFKPVVQAMKDDGWILQKFSRGEIA